MNNVRKLGFGIVAFEGVEHLKNITYEVRPVVQTIVVCLQRLSYHGDPISETDVEVVNGLKEVGLVDEVIWFEPSDLHEGASDTDRPRYVETDKRNFILSYLENDGCSHSIVVDSDEYYDGVDFARAVGEIDANPDIKVSYCGYVNYWRDYYHYLVWPFRAYVPFICESGYRYSYGCRCVSCSVDPSRIVRIGADESYAMFKWSMVKMHHLSWIRRDIRKKIMSWSSKRYFPNQTLGLIYRKYLTWKDGDEAYITIMCPGNRVSVKNMGRRFINPRYRLDEIPSKDDLIDNQ